MKVACGLNENYSNLNVSIEYKLRHFLRECLQELFADINVKEETAVRNIFVSGQILGPKYFLRQIYGDGSRNSN